MGLVLESAAPAAASLAPGFRFHPTDEELVRYYLKRKICGKPFRFDAISEIDIYKCEPWDLPGMSRLKSRDLEWYFFSVLDKKYGNGSKTNRATERGYWKTTGKDRPVLHYSRTVGMKKTLVYHSGRAPRGERSNYVMHEYRLIDEALEKAGLPLEAFVLCRVFQKSGSGPKNGEQYGAPLIEDEWEDDEVVMVPGEGPFEELADGDDACLDGNDLVQILDADIPSEDVPLPKSFYYEDDNSYVQDGLDLVSDDQHVEEPVESVDDDQKHFVDLGQTNCDPEHPDAHKLFEFPVETNEDKKPVRHEYIGVPNNTMNDVEEDYLLDEPYMDTSNNIPLDDGLFLETNDLSNPIKVDPSSFDTLEEYLTYFDALDDNTSQYIAFDPSNMIGSENCVSDAVSVSQMCVYGDASQGTTENQHLVQDRDNDVASTSNQKPENFGSDIPDSFIKQSSCKLGSIPAAPAFASEFPSKDAALGLHSAYHPSSAIHVTAGMIEIRNMTLSGNGTFWSAGKNADVTIILSFDLPYNTSSSARLEPMDGVVLGKAGSATSHGWLYLISLWVLILSASFKIGNYIYTGNAL